MSLLLVRLRNNNASLPLLSSRGTAPSIPQRITNYSDPRNDQRGDPRGDPRSASQYGETSERWRFVYHFFFFLMFFFVLFTLFFFLQKRPI